MGKRSPNCVSGVTFENLALLYSLKPSQFGWMSWHTFQEPSLIIFSIVAHGGPFWIGLILSGITLGAKLFLCFCFFHFFEPMVWRASTMHPSLLWTMKMQKPASGTLPLPKKQENTLLFKKIYFFLKSKNKSVQWCLCFSLPYFGHVPGYWASLLLEAISYFKRLLKFLSYLCPLCPLFDPFCLK